ncbi:MAG: hypothetical protein JKY18_08650, partial [Flavobacteriales bacterium]|nr:hypothetical protein [Flavobacteriales bacterium]
FPEMDLIVNGTGKYVLVLRINNLRIFNNSQDFGIASVNFDDPSLLNKYVGLKNGSLINYGAIDD